MLLGIAEQPSHDGRPPELPGATLSEELHTPPLASDACLPRLLLVVQQVHSLINAADEAEQ